MSKLLRKFKNNNVRSKIAFSGEDSVIPVCFRALLLNP